MNEEVKKSDILKRVAKLKEIPEGFRFNQARVWAGIQVRLEKERVSRQTRRVIIIWLAIGVIAMAIVVAARYFSSNKSQPTKQPPGKTGLLIESTKNTTYESSLQKCNYRALYHEEICEAAS